MKRAEWLVIGLWWLVYGTFVGWLVASLIPHHTYWR